MHRSIQFKLRGGERLFSFPGDFISEQEIRQFLCLEFGVPGRDVLTVGTNPEKFQFTRETPEVPPLQTAYSEDAGYDLSAWLPEDQEITISSGQEYPIPTGLRVQLPLGWAGLVLPRSSLRKRWGLVVSNSPGLIDPGYRGPLMVLLHNPGLKPRTVTHDDRIAQLVLTPTYPLWPSEAEELSETERGSQGLGSSGGKKE